MNKDLSIKRIVNAYYCKTDKWQRDFFDVRHYDGVVLFTEGEIDYTFSDKTLNVKKGDFLFLPGNIPYSGKKVTENVAFFVIDFECFSEDELLKLTGAYSYSVNQCDLWRVKFSEAVGVWGKQYSDVSLKLKAFVYSVLCDAVSSQNNKKIHNSTNVIIDFISENIGDTSLTLKSLCEKFYISESQLRRNIMKQTGMNPNEYILKLRINKAKNELINSSKSIGEIASSCGFSSQYYFSRCFSEYTGITPSKYRMLTFGV